MSEEQPNGPQVGDVVFAKHYGEYGEVISITADGSLRLRPANGGSLVWTVQPNDISGGPDNEGALTMDKFGWSPRGERN
jgi:hypothetical protein